MLTYELDGGLSIAVTTYQEMRQPVMSPFGPTSHTRAGLESHNYRKASFPPDLRKNIHSVGLGTSQRHSPPASNAFFAGLLSDFL